MLTEAKLRKRVYEATFKRGSSLFNAGGVLEMEEEDQGDRMLIRAKVQGSGSRAYDVKLLMDESEDKILDYDCECPAYASFSGMCKHCVATLLELIHRNEPEYSPKRLSDFLPFSDGKTSAPKSQNPDLDALLRALGVTRASELPNAPSRTSPEPPVRTPARKKLESTPGLQELIRPYLLSDSENPMQRIESEVELEPRLSFIGDQLKVSFKIGITQKYVLKDLREFLNHVTTESNYRYGKKLEFLHREEAFTEKARAWLAFIRKLLPNENTYTGRYASYYGLRAREDEYLEIDKSHMDELMALLEGEVFNGVFLGCQAESWIIRDEMPDFGATLKQKADGAVFNLRRFIHMEGEHYLYFPKEGIIRRVDKGVFGKALGFSFSWRTVSRTAATFPEMIFPSFLRSFFRSLKRPSL